MNQNTKFIKRAESKINLGKLMQTYFRARDDFALAVANEEDITYLKRTMELTRKKIEHELFEMWKDGKIVITFE
jgi:hypothetical protein